MKAIITKTFFTVVMIYISVYTVMAQGNHITCSLQNCSSPSSNTLEFDLFIVNDGSTQLKLNSLAFGINVNDEVLPDTNDVLSMSFTGTSDLPEAITTSLSFGYSSALRQLKLTSLPSAVDASLAPLLPANVSKKVGRFSVTNQSHDWIEGSVTNFVLNTIVGKGNTNTGAVAYVSTNTVGTNFNNAGNRSVSLNCSMALGCVQLTFFADADGDGYGNAGAVTQACAAPAGYVVSNTDCNDANASVHPDQNDLCNSIDDNCNSLVDENAIVATITPSSAQTICDGTSLTLTANSGVGISYQWKRGTKNLGGATNLTYTTKKAGNYSVYETNGFNCSSTSPTVKISVSPSPDAMITTGNLNLCAGTVTLTANSGSGYLYQWMKGDNLVPGATNITYTAAKKATYKVIVANSYGCSTTSKGVKVINSCREESEEPGVIALNISPNPSSGMITLHMVFEGQQSISIKLFDILGKEILSSDEGTNNDSFTKQLDLGYLSSGAYFLHVIHDGNREVRKVVIQK